MADSDYLIEIVAKLKDEASAKLALLKAELDRIKGTQDADKATQDLGRSTDDLGRKAENTEGKQRKLREEHERGTTVRRDASNSSESLQDALERERKSAEATAQAHQRLGESQSGVVRTRKDFEDSLNKGKVDEAEKDVKKLNERMSELQGRHDELKNSIPKTSEEFNKQRVGLQALANEINAVSNAYARLDAASKEAEKGRLQAEEARAQARRLQALEPSSRQPIEVDTAARLLEQKEIEREKARVQRQREQAENARKDLELNASKMEAAYDSFDKKVRSGSLSESETRRGYQDFSRELNKISRSFDAGSEDAERWGVKADEAGKKARNAASESVGSITQALNRSDWDSGGKVLEAIDAKVGDLGVRVTGVSSALRGFFDLFKIGFSQQLISGVLSLAGGFISLASAAAQAGAVLAGAFVSGVGQAIPMISIVIASVERFKQILQAVSIASQAEQQHYFDPTEKERQQLQNASQLISAQQQLSNSSIQLFDAQERVRDSQIALTEARVDAVRNIQNLNIAEKEAQLQAEGSNLAIVEAKRQLQIAIQSGNVAGLKAAELSVREAELASKKSDIEVPRAERDARLARERGVSGAPTVISAVEGYSGAKQAVVQAQQAAEAAQRQMKITELQMAAPSSRMTSQESQLKFLESQMSGVEKRLFEALVSLEKELKSPDSPLKKITDYFIEPFLDAVSSIKKLLGDSSFLAPIDELAKKMGEGLGRLEKATYGPSGTTFFETMAKDASSNIPIVVSAIEGIMKLFEDVAKAADPAFHKLSQDWNNFWTALDKKYEGKGLERLTDFFNKSVTYAEDFAHLGTALFGLFKAIGSDAAPQGAKTITSFTESIKEATGWVTSHGPEVTKFFREAREGLSLLGQMVGAIGLSLIKVFSVSSLTAFSGFIQQVLLPGLRNVVTVFGFITTKVLEVFDYFGNTGRVILEVVGTVIGFGVALAKIVAIVKEIIAFIGEMKVALAEIDFEALILNPWAAVGAIIGGAAYALGLFDTAQKKAKITTEESNRALEQQAESLRVIKNLNDEYKSSKLSVEEADTRVISSEQALAKARKDLAHPEKPLSHEERTEAVLGIKSDEQAVQRARLTAEETHKEFEKLPERQKETVYKENRENQKNLGEVRTHSKGISEEIKELENKKREQESFVRFFEKSELGSGVEVENQKKKLHETNTTLIAKNKELRESQEEIARATKRSNEIIVQSNEITSQGASKLSDAYGEAFRKFNESVKGGAETASAGMTRIHKLVDDALRRYGVTPAELKSAAAGVSSIAQGAAGIAGAASGAISKLAAGGYIPARSGGNLAQVAEGGHDEVVLTTDPRHADRQRQLLGQYFRAAPHMAGGGQIKQKTLSEFDQSYAGSHLERLLAAISMVNDANMPYRLGGGHSEPSRFEPFDCSGFVDYIVQQSGYKVPSTVSGSIGEWGFPGGPGLVSIYFNGEHTFMDAGGRYAGTSGFARKKDNGGAGWFEEAPNPAYLSRFNVVHLPDVEGTGSWSSTAKALENHGQELTDRGYGSGAIAFMGAAKAAAGGATSKAMELQQILSPVIKGGGAIGQVVQGALDLTTQAANKYLEKLMPSGASPGAGSIGSSWSGSWVQVMEQIAKAKHWSLSAWKDVVNRESGGNPNARNPSSGAYGLGQFLGSTLSEYAKYGATSPNPVKQIEAMGQYISDRYGTPTSAEQHEEDFGWYAAGGIISPHRIIMDYTRRLATRHLRKGLFKFATGGRAPWGGEPVPIIAHEGERIMNPAQYHEAARLGGLSPGALDRHMGFDSSPRQHFASGGIPTVSRSWAQPQSGSSSSRSMSIEALSVTAQEAETLPGIMNIFTKIKEAFAKLKKISKDKFNKDLEKIITEITEEQNGVITRLQEGREFLKASLTKTAVSHEYNINRKTGVVKLGAGGQVGIDTQTEAVLSQESRYLEQESKLIQNTINETKKEKPSAHRTTALATLRKAQKELGEAIDQNIEARYQAETQKLQDQISKVNSSYQVISQELSTTISGFQALGQFSQVGAIDKQTQQAAEGQLNQLSSLLKGAESIGNTEMANQIKQEMSGLRQTITNAVVEQISSSQQAIQQSSNLAESKTSMLESLSKTAAARGNYTEAGSLERQGLENKQINLLSTRAQDEQLKARAEQEGDTGAVLQLTEELRKNSAEIAENNLALQNNITATRELTLGQIQREGALNTGIYKSGIQAFETIGKTTGFTNVKGMLGLAEGESNVLGAERTKEGGLNQQAKEVGLSVEGMSPSQVLAYLATPQAQSTISNKEKNGTEAEKNHLEKLIQALEQNSIATLENKEEIAKLNGQLNQPQSFSTSAFQSLRSSFFTGMGGLLPGYAESLPAGARPTEMPQYGSASPGSSGGNTMNISLTHPVEKLDPQLFGEELSHHVSTAPSVS
jgi:Transglycosylase SLT domain